MIKKILYLSLQLLVMSPILAQESSPAVIVPVSKQQINLTFAPVAKKVGPAVVNIYAVRVVQQKGYSILLDDPVFRHFFGDTLPPQGEKGPSRIQSSLGSGVIVRPDGIVITNYHVIKFAEAIKVVLMDGREFEAEVAVKDPRTDLVALRLKTDEKNLPHLELRDADELEVGDVLLAIGNPFGFGHTVTMGIVSALARNQLGVQDFRSFIQTDAAINPGNSGGPLVSLDGRLVGINTAIFSHTGSSIGLGFAIPSNLVGPVIASVDQGGNVSRPWVGIEVQTVNSEIARALNLKQVGGVIIKQLYEQSIGAKAGLKKGDLILKVNGKDINNESSFRFRIATAKIGQDAHFTIQRGDKVLDVTVPMKAAPELADNKKVELSGRHPLAGASVTGFSAAVSDEIGIPFEGAGVVIFGIRPGSAAGLSGLLPGDVITKVNGKPIETVDDLVRNLGRSRQGWEIEFRRAGTMHKLFIQSW